MDTKEIVIICLTIILVALIIGGAIFMTNSNNDADKNPLNQTKVSNNVTADRLSYDEVVEDNSNDIVSEVVKYNEQAGGGHYREVTYNDGNFRQFDVETGELIGSSFSSDQKYLPSME